MWARDSRLDFVVSFALRPRPRAPREALPVRLVRQWRESISPAGRAGEGTCGYCLAVRRRG